MDDDDPFALELSLDRVDAALAHELPAHVRAFARAYVDGVAPPAAPDVASSAATVALAVRAARLPATAARGLALLRLAAPLTIERQPAVAVARAGARSWTGLYALARARDAASVRLFGCGALDLIHHLHGATPVDGAAVVPASLAAWRSADRAVDAAAVEDAWRELARRHGVTRELQIVRAAARPRAFIVEPGREVIVVVPPRLETPYDRFVVLHELGHAIANLTSPSALPRVIDEAAASYLARLVEHPDAAWYSSIAVSARARRTLLAHALADVERAVAAGDDTAGPPLAALPPSALWDDPGAQATYVAAEALADRLWRDLGPSPAPGALAAALATERARLDRVPVV